MALDHLIRGRIAEEVVTNASVCPIMTSLRGCPEDYVIMAVPKACPIIDMDFMMSMVARYNRSRIISLILDNYIASCDRGCMMQIHVRYEPILFIGPKIY